MHRGHMASQVCERKATGLLVLESSVQLQVPGMSLWALEDLNL